MGHHIQGVIARSSVVARIAQDFPGAEVVPLEQALLWVPTPEWLLDAIDETTRGDALRTPITGEHVYLHFVARYLEQITSRDVAMYFETDYFGGLGAQSAAVYRDGVLVLDAGRASRPGPINAGLALLGVLADAGRDAFDTVGLQHHRRMPHDR
ncbi:hypothetical protein [Sandaracinus amylolyticus]|uniref:hypothetical protein n=1 Tax=Sandaracinus amylolyticus TaxID=927083 RepID=UPI001F2C0326|nr:hypothetical protein [Sandaracinus amylolyticus]UJR82170.1 Hypothetical protein I5071_42350 [Sandaracinus amylolyticus]